MQNAITAEGSRGTILIFDEGLSLAQVSAVVSELRFTPVPALVDVPLDFDLLPPVYLAIVNEAAAGALEQWSATPCDAPTIKIAGGGSFEARLQAAREGIAGIVDAPLSSEDLTSWVRHFYTLEATRQSHVLIVDDDQMTREIGAQALRSEDMSVGEVESAREAFKYLQNHTVDAILLDLQMPDVDGLELARIIRQDQQNLSLPIIFLSGERDPLRQLQARRLGGDDFIMKPIMPSRLREIVQMRLERAGALKSLIERDSLTGLLNHARFHAHLESEIGRSSRTDAEISVALIDLDHFKSVNDTYGHQVGDRVIRSLATLLSTALRKTDLIGRLGGEEFGVVLLDTDLESAAHVVDRLRETFEASAFEVDNDTFKASFSAGVSTFRKGRSPADMVRFADAALYQAKAQGRGRTVTEADEVFDPPIKVRA
ncbi:GGDEF domain-containing protein [Notoacmeibacter ruber]|uniref:diguanylate cyclase n=1 Tax=Notoacmeibacter ruber TaxID=2670375 RepID=A0A3L7J9P6_9HYPH|nr:diguanylate cyclase [Notoacmeibacter ruber]RLQ87220.1 diguanylate cyclase [Notoacmeibacter ruber]